MISLLEAIWLKQSEHRVPMTHFYREFKITRQGFHQALKAMGEKEAMMKRITLMVVNYRSRVDFRAGSRSLYYNLGIKELFDIGITKFEALMSDHRLSLKPLRVRVITTKSVKQSWNYPNLADGLRIDNINQFVVGDLTYIYIEGKRFFLFCLIDVYSAHIVGYSFSKRMRSIDAQQAAHMWIKLRGSGKLVGCIHHTDGGSQYFSGAYLAILNNLEALISCARNCLQNGYAEQRNGLLKYHLLPTIRTSNTRGITIAIGRIINTYNKQRKQQALGWKSPVEFESHILELQQRPERKLFNFTELKNGF